MSFHVGQKIVCVDTASPVIRGRQSDIARVGLREKEIYTVSALKIDLATGVPTVQVAELNLDEWTWLQARRFRPLIERKTDISSLVALLNPKNHKSLEDA